MTEQELGAKITEIRKQHGWTQKQIADMIGVSTSTICRWESGTYTISAIELLRLVRALHLPLSYFLPNDDTEAYWHQRYQELRTRILECVVPTTKA